jgi:hypothetical protein
VSPVDALGSRILASRYICALAMVSMLGLTACSGSGGGLTTGSLFGGAQAKPVTDERTERALLAGATSARAARCGYNFDPNRLRHAYIAYETAQGGSPDELAKAEKAFDYTRTSLAAKIAKEEDFCSEAKTKEIKAALTKQLAGDFTTPPKKPEVQVPSGWFGSAGSQQPMDREKIFDPVTR